MMKLAQTPRLSALSGKTAVITGAASGIGRALSLHCAQQGMSVVIADISAAGLELLSQELTSEDVAHTVAVIDVTDAAEVEALAAQCFEQYGNVQLLFNNAGIIDSAHSWEYSAEQWQQLMSVNVTGVVNGLRSFVPRMLAQQCESQIINTGSLGALFAAPMMAAYTASKMAVRGITETLHYELRAMDANIGVSLLCPGPVASGMSAAHADRSGSRPTVDVAVEARALLAKPGFLSPADCAEKVFEGIRQNQFWIFTHPEFKQTYLKNAQALIDEQNPVFEPLVFEGSHPLS